MNTEYFPKEIYHQLNGFCGYFQGALKAAFHNFNASIQFNHLTSSSSTSQVADSLFDQLIFDSSLDLKAKHFFTHILVGSLLMIPILNVFVFMGFESEDDDTDVFSDQSDLPALQNIQPQIPKPLILNQQNNLPDENSKPKSRSEDDDTDIFPDQSDLPALQNIQPQIPKPLILNQQNNLPDENSKPKSRIVLENSQAIQKLKGQATSRVSQKALMFEGLKANHYQWLVDQEVPVLGGERSNPVTIATFKQIESTFTKNFFRLFPNETCISEYAGLRKKLNASDDAFGILLDDSKYIESLFLNTEGFTPEARFNYANQNLSALEQFIHDQFPHLDREFYFLGNFKNDMQNSINNIPYIRIIKILFKASPEEFLQELSSYKFVLAQALKGEKTPVRIDSPRGF